MTQKHLVTLMYVNKRQTLLEVEATAAKPDRSKAENSFRVTISPVVL